MAAALFAGAAFGGGGTGVNLLSTFASMASWGASRRLARGRGSDQSNYSDLYKSLGTVLAVPVLCRALTLSLVSAQAILGLVSQCSRTP